MKSASGKPRSAHRAVERTAIHDGAPEHPEIQRVGETGEIFDGPRLLDASVIAARQEAVAADDGERSGEEERHPEAGGQQK